MRDLDDARCLDDREWFQGLHAKRWQRERANSLKKASTALRLIVKDLGTENPIAEAEKTERRLLRHIENHKAARLRDHRYDARIASWRSEAEKPSERWACHLVRLETNRQSIGRLRGAQQINRKQAIDNAAGVKIEELRPVERRAVEILKRDATKKRRVRPKKNITEKRAIRLAESVKRNWFPNKQKSKVVAEHDVDQPILLSITDVISIAAPIIEEFARGPIAFRKRGSDSDPPSFEALYWMVCAYAKDGATCKKSTVKRLLGRVRKRADARGTQDRDLRIDIAPELGGPFQ